MTMPTKARIAALIKDSHLTGQTEVWSTNSLGDAVIVQYVHMMNSVPSGTLPTTLSPEGPSAMPKYEIEVVTTIKLNWVFEIEADSPDEAKQLAAEGYSDRRWEQEQGRAAEAPVVTWIGEPKEIERDDD